MHAVERPRQRRTAIHRKRDGREHGADFGHGTAGVGERARQRRAAAEPARHPLAPVGEHRLVWPGATPTDPPSNAGLQRLDEQPLAPWAVRTYGRRGHAPVPGATTTTTRRAGPWHPRRPQRRTTVSRTCPMQRADDDAVIDEVTDAGALVVGFDLGDLDDPALGRRARAGCAPRRRWSGPCGAGWRRAATTAPPAAAAIRAATAHPRRCWRGTSTTNRRVLC
ncbi:MAG: hypothetical protein WKF58_02725 [Ilumatobacteraceae bacterium]